MVNLRTARIVVTGRTQTGKTSLVRCSLLGELGSYIIYDPDYQFTGYGYPVDIVPDLIEAIRKGERQIIFQVRDVLMRGDMWDGRREEFEMLCQVVNRLKNVTLIIDEVAEVTRRPGTKAATMPPTLGLIIRRRMKAPHNIGVIVTTQRMKDADVDFLTQAQLTYTFQQNASDAKYVAEKLGIDTKEMREVIMSLPDYNFLKYNHKNGDISRGDFGWVEPPTNGQLKHL